jgi:hypothetical protein
MSLALQSNMRMKSHLSVMLLSRPNTPVDQSSDAISRAPECTRATPRARPSCVIQHAKLAEKSHPEMSLLAQLRILDRRLASAPELLQPRYRCPGVIDQQWPVGLLHCRRGTGLLASDVRHEIDLRQCYIRNVCSW